MHGKKMIMVIKWFTIMMLPVIVAAAPTNPECVNATCGNISVPHPFGIESSCAKDKENFFLICDDSAKLWLGKKSDNILVHNISVDEASIRVSFPTSFVCHNGSGEMTNSSEQNVTLREAFTFSNSSNKFITYGCNIAGWVGDTEGKLYGSGCVSLCYGPEDVSHEDSCDGRGCCKTSIPTGLQTLQTGVERVLLNGTVDTDTPTYNPCGYAFLAEENSFHSSKMSLSYLPYQVENPQVVLDWTVGRETCNASLLNSPGYSCGHNTTCVNSTDGPGYRCSCKDGYRGNPYLDDHKGCQDINECKEPKKYTCHGTCENTDGNYICHCPFAKYGNAKTGPCQGLGIPGLAAVVAAVVCSIVTIVVTIIGWKKRRREKYFKENGGLVLKNQRVKIFKQKELEKATKNYHESHLLGQGGSGSVYKGILIDGTQVAIKKPLEVNKTQVMQDFQHEIGIISQVNHKHVVKLLGICLETKVPLLVYEYISNGTLFQHIHDKTSEILRPWEIRLRIAADIANALDYLHSLADPPIIHRDVKSLNILLDENYTAKVSDFGASVLNPLGKSSIITKVIGTRGYLDPEYLLTGELTIKSDVYSFGVVLLELLTRERPVSIIQSFLSSIDDNIVLNNLKVGVTEESEIEQIEVVFGLAKRCLHRSGKERPMMGEVAEELTRLIRVIDNFHTA